MHGLRPATLEYRIASASDALCVGVVGAQAWCDAFARDGINPSLAKEVVEYFSTEVMAEELARPNLTFLLVLSGGNLIGFAQLDHESPQPLAPEGRTIELHRLYVLRSHAMKGVGKALLAKAEEWASAKAARSIWLTTWLPNEGALAFFTRMGYVEVGTDTYKFEGQEYENRILARALP